MNRRPGHVTVTTEVAMCSFCGRPRNLRREEHQLGTLVRTIVTCETCHRTLSSTMGVATAEPPAAAAEAPEAEPTPASATRTAKRAPAMRTPAAAAKAKPAAPKSTKARTSRAR